MASSTSNLDAAMAQLGMTSEKKTAGKKSNIITSNLDSTMDNLGIAAKQGEVKPKTKAKTAATWQPPEPIGYTNPLVKGAAEVLDTVLNRPGYAFKNAIIQEKAGDNALEQLTLGAKGFMQGLTGDARPTAQDFLKAEGISVNPETLGGKAAGLVADILTNPVNFIGGGVGIATKAPTAVKIARGAGIGAGFTGASAFGEQLPAKDVAISALMGGALGGALTGAGEGIGKALAKPKTTPATIQPESWDFIKETPAVELPAATVKPEYAPWVREDLIEQANTQQAQAIKQALTQQRNPFEGMGENQFNQPWPEYIPPVVDSNFTADAFGNVQRGLPLQALPGAPQRLALPGSNPLQLTTHQMQALPARGRIPKQEIKESTKAGELWYVDPEGAAGSNTDYLAGVSKQYNDLIKTEVDNIKGTVNGVLEYGDMDNGYRRASLNPSWYRDFWEKFKRPPTEGEYRDMAIENLTRGNAETGAPANDEFLSVLSELSRGQKLPDEWHNLSRNMRDMQAMNEPELTPLIDEMGTERGKVEPYGLNRDLGRMDEIEAGYRKRMNVQDSNYGQYDDLNFKRTSAKQEKNFKFFQQAFSDDSWMDTGEYSIKHAPEAFDNPEFAAANALVKANTGRDVIPFKGTNEIAGAQSGNSIFLNKDTKQPASYVALHEVGHDIKVSNPEAHQRMLQIVQEHIADNEGLANHYTKMGYAPDKHNEELLSDAFAEVGHDPSFWARVRNEAPELLKPILDAIDRVIANVKAKVGNDMSIMPYLQNVEQMRNRLADEYRGYLAEQKGYGTGRGEMAAKVDRPFGNTNTPEFRQWFGDSKVVDEQGKPLVVYHGTGKDFNEFQISQDGAMGPGVYVTKNRTTAESYANDGRNGNVNPKTHELYVNAKDVVDAWKPSREHTDKVYDWLDMENSGITPEKYHNSILERLPEMRGKEDNWMGWLEVAADDAAHRGQDPEELLGILDPDAIKSGDDYVIRNHYGNIKSVNNHGTWDATNPDINLKLENKTSPLDDIQAMVQFGAANIRKGGRTNFEKLIRQQFGDKLDQYTPEMQTRIMDNLWAHSRELSRTGQTVLQLGQESIPMTRKGTTATTTPLNSQNLNTRQVGGNAEGIASRADSQAIRETNKQLNKIYDRIDKLSEGQMTDNKKSQIDALYLEADTLLAKIKEHLNAKGDIAETPLPETYRDISGFQAETQDVARNFKDFYGKDIELEPGSILDRLNDAKGQNVDYQQQWTDRLKSEVVDGLGIGKNTPLSKLVQQYGEGEITLDQLKQRRPRDWQNVVKADGWFRNAYDTILDDVNRVIEQIYPGQPDRLVPKRQDYYRHFRDLEGFEGFQNMLGSPANISPELAGRSEFVKPKTKWASYKQRRGLGEFKRDAVGGFLDYLPAASYSVNIDPMIGEFRGLSDNLAKATEKTQDANVMIRYLQDYANGLAGKTSGWDRKIQEFLEGRGGSRLAMNAITWLNNRAKANSVMLNPGSALSQLTNIPNGVAFAKLHSVPGIGKALLSIFKEDPARASSIFMKERFSGKMYRQFDTNMLDQPKNFAAWLLETSDRLGTEMIWQSCYSKGLHTKGIADPVKYADAHTKRLVAGRGIGEMAQIQRSKLFQVLAPFQVEVGNLWKVQKDFMQKKDFVGLVTLYVGLWLANNAMENIRGQRIAFDPINAMIEASKEIANPENDPTEKALKAGGRIAGEVLGNIPGGQTIAAIYPEYGNKEMGLPTRKELFGSEDPTRYGTGPLFVKAVSNPVKYLVLPYGGGQVDKMINAAEDINRGGAYSGDKLKYPVAPTTENKVKGVLFGPGAMDETKDYYNENRRPLSEKQTRQVERGPNRQRNYDRILQKREIDSLNEKITKIRKDRSLTGNEKREKIKPLMEELRQVRAGK